MPGRMPASDAAFGDLNGNQADRARGRLLRNDRIEKVGRSDSGQWPQAGDSVASIDGGVLFIRLVDDTIVLECDAREESRDAGSFR